MKIESKTFVAACTFSVGDKSFTKGDTVPAGRTLAYLLSLDAGFVEESKKKPATPITDTPKEASDGSDQ